MILFKFILGIAKIVLRILIFLAIVACLVPFFITMVGNFTLEGGFWNAFTTALGAYHYGELAVQQRMIGLIFMVIGLLGGLVFSIISIAIKKAGFFTFLFGLLSVAGAIVVYPTLDQAAIGAFFEGTTSVYNYVVLLTLTWSLLMTTIGLYHVCSGLSAMMK